MKFLEEIDNILGTFITDTFGNDASGDYVAFRNKIVDGVKSELKDYGIPVDTIVDVVNGNFDPKGQLDLTIPDHTVWQSSDGRLWYAPQKSKTFMETLGEAVSNFSLFGTLSAIWKGINTKPSVPNWGLIFECLVDFNEAFKWDFDFVKFNQDIMNASKNKKGKNDPIKDIAVRSLVVKDIMALEKGNVPKLLIYYIRNAQFKAQFADIIVPTAYKFNVSKNVDFTKKYPNVTFASILGGATLIFKKLF